jgi:hypothetical protein
MVNIVNMANMDPFRGNWTDPIVQFSPKISTQVFYDKTLDLICFFFE